MVNTLLGAKDLVLQSVGPYLPNQKKLDSPLISQAESSFQNLYLFGLRVYHIQPMLDRRVVEILTNLYREIGHRHWRLGPLRFPCYSEPNIPGQIYFGRIPHDNYATASSGSWITAVDGAANSNKYQFAGNTSQLSAASVGFVFDPSTYNNTYRNVQTVQVDALKGLCLIKSF